MCVLSMLRITLVTMSVVKYTTGMPMTLLLYCPSVSCVMLCSNVADITQ